MLSNNPTDQVLVTNYLKGDSNSFEKLLSRHKNRIFAFIFSVDVYLDFLLNDISVEGWTTVVILISLLGGIQLLTLGILGEYLWRTSNDSKKRPLYLLEEKIGL